MAGDNAKKPVFFWDSGIIIQWLKQTPENDRTESDIKVLSDMITLAETGKMTLLVSALWRVEILPFHYDAKEYKKLSNAFSGQSIVEVAISNKILTLAQELRNQSLIDHNNQNGRKLKTPDAIQLASAIIYRADIFHTYDSGLLLHDRRVQENGYILKVTKPSILELALA